EGVPFADQLWAVLEDPAQEPGARLRAACALAAVDANSARWRPVREDVATLLVTADPLRISGWVELLEPVRPELLDPLRKEFAKCNANGKSPVAASILAEFLAGDTPALVALLLEAEA